MKIEINKNIGTFVHIYDFLNGGYYSAHHQLEYYNKNAYKLYKEKNKKELIKLYNELKSDIPTQIVEILERSAGIRYFCCDGCHDAEINKVSISSNEFVLELDTIGMLGCLNINSNNCIVRINATHNEAYEDIINDFKIADRMIWLSSDIYFNEKEETFFELEVEAYFENKPYERYKYTFIIEDIKIESI